MDEPLDEQAIETKPVADEPIDNRVFNGTNPNSLKNLMPRSPGGIGRIAPNPTKEKKRKPMRHAALEVLNYMDIEDLKIDRFDGVALAICKRQAKRAILDGHERAARFLRDTAEGTPRQTIEFSESPLNISPDSIRAKIEIFFSGRNSQDGSIIDVDGTEPRLPEKTGSDTQESE